MHGCSVYFNNPHKETGVDVAYNKAVGTGEMHFMLYPQAQNLSDSSGVANA